MTEAEIILFTAKLLLGGIIAFLAIALWSKTRDGAWMSLVIAAVTNYAGIISQLLFKLGIVMLKGFKIFGRKVTQEQADLIVQISFSAIPALFVIIAFILMLSRLSRGHHE